MYPTCVAGPALPTEASCAVTYMLGFIAACAESEKFLLSESALDDIDLTDDQYSLTSNKNNKEIDFDALLEARMLDEVGAVGWKDSG